MLLTGRRLWAAGAASAAVVALGPVVLLGHSSPAAAVAERASGADCDNVGPDDVDNLTVTGENDANNLLHVPDATQVLKKANRRPGQGVTVVVVDSGFAGLNRTAVKGLASSHGLTVASIIAGPDQKDPEVDGGIAPAATLVDAKFYDVPRGAGEEGKAEPTSAALAQRLNAVAGARGKGAGPTIVVVPVELARTAPLVKAVERLVASGVLVIAAAGDRPQDGDGFLGDFFGEAKPGEDAVSEIWPAAVDGVVSVGVSLPNSLEAVVRNSGVDLAAPGSGSVALGLNGGFCVTQSVSTHWASAQVAGVAALVWSRYPQDSAQQVRDRLEGTAAGNGGSASPLVGHGAVQPVEALQRAADALDRQDHDPEVVRRGTAPKERADLLSGTRDHVVWWGIGGAGAIVVLLVLRPVLGRRRR